MATQKQKQETADSRSRLESCMREVRTAQQQYAAYSQEQVDAIFYAAAMAANAARLPLAQQAAAETGMGIAEDKVIKNQYAAEYIYHAYRSAKTCGIIARDEAFGTVQIAEPVGVVAAVIPTTNPTSTAIFKALLCLKTRNGVVFSPHPRAKACTIAAAQVIRDAAVAAGAPEGIIQWIEEPSLELTNELMRQADLILATGGPGMVHAAYTSGTPAIGVGSGNTPAIVAASADIRQAVNDVIHSKTFDNGMICASEQSLLVDDGIYDEVLAELQYRGCYRLNAEETAAVRQQMLKGESLNPAIVGQSAVRIAEMAGVQVPPDTKVLLAEVKDVTQNEPFAREKLSPVLAVYRTQTFGEALDMAERLIQDGGYGHTAVLHVNAADHPEQVQQFSERMKACRILLNTPASQGGIGDLYNFALPPSLTLGCGTWGGNSVSENVGVKHLLNIKTIAERRENMLWFRVPEKVYFKRGCLPVALQELQELRQAKRVFVVTDQFLHQHGMVRQVTERLQAMGMDYQIFSDVQPDPTLESAKAGAEQMAAYQPDVILAYGGGSAMDAAKIMWVMYEHPAVQFSDMAMRFADIRKRVYAFPQMGSHSCFVAVPTSSGTGSEVTPFAVITDAETGMKYPLADYALLPNMAIVDADVMMSQPQGLTAAAGMDALTHALEAYVSVMANDFTDAMALSAIRLIFQYLPRCYENGADAAAREKMAHAATMAGMAFANAFLGLCHSMAHKLGAFHHLPHGTANALLITEIMRYNAAEAPAKMGTFPQYAYPQALRRYAMCAEALGLSGSSDEEKLEALIEAVEQLRRQVGMQDSIQAYGIEEAAFLETLDEMTEQAFDDQCTGANPRYPLMAEIRALYLKAYYGR